MDKTDYIGGDKMGEIGITTMFDALDALESISKMYSVKQLSNVDMMRIQSQAESYAMWIREQRNENEERRNIICQKADLYQEALERIIDKILAKPKMVAIYKDVFESLLKTNNNLILEISKIRIRNE